MRGRWTHGTFILGGSVVGTVEHNFHGTFFAYGCLADWEDTPLGSHETEEAARKRVERWVEEAVGDTDE